MTDDDRDVEHVDVLVVGAGLSGIAAAHYLQAECGWATYAVFEAREALGGTWDLFRYPGIRSDSDMFTLGYSFRPWTHEDAIAEGGDILDYLQATAAEEGIDRHIRYRHRVIAADWSTTDSRWHVTAERTDTGETVTITCGWLFSCTGYYRYDRGHKPAFAGTDSFGGQLIHPQHWPDDLRYDDQKVVVIGSGATAVTLIPALAERAAHVTMLQRSPSYVAALPRRNGFSRAVRALLPTRGAGWVLRWLHALGTQASYAFCQWKPEWARRKLIRDVAAHLPDGFDVDTHFTPAYDPWDQRLCLDPDGALFTAISEGRAGVVTDEVDTFTPSGVKLRSGAELDADIVVTATGLELLFVGGIGLSVDGESVDLSSRLTYKGALLEDVPNFSVALGYTNASWTLKCELSCALVCRVLNEMRSSGHTRGVARNHDSSVSAEPLLALSSGYIRRAADQFPRQGARDPWRVHQSFWRDHRLMKRSDLLDGALELTGPQPTRRADEPVDVVA